MKDKDAAIIKVLSDIGYADEPELTPEQQKQFERALDPEKQFLHDVEKLFNPQIAEAWYDDEDAKYSYPNPVPFPSEKMHDHAYEVGDAIDRKILKKYEQQHNVELSFEEGGKVAIQGREELGNIETVPMNKILASERSLDGEHIKRLVQGKQKSNETPWFLKIQDKYYAQDGNHRIAAAYLRGEKEIKGLVLDTARI